MQPPVLQQLQEKVGKKVAFRINDNRSTLLSVRWDSKQTRVSLHRFFLDAPTAIVDDLACYIRKQRPDLSPIVKAFMEKKTETLAYSKREHEICTKGAVYDLADIYREINHKYFKNSINLKITWFGLAGIRCRSRITFGLFDSLHKLVKIHRIMDSTFFPLYVVRFVVYHEMLHHIYQPEFNLATGRRKIHTKEFMEHEKKFEEYKEANEWLKSNNKKFFKGRYGWT